MANPNMNYELLVDGQEVKFFNGVTVNRNISALSGFTINLQNPDNFKANWFRENSEIEFKASWGDRRLRTQIKGFVKQRNFSIGVGRSLSISGIDSGDYMLRRKPWTENKTPIIYNNEKASLIMEDLIARVPELNLKITRLASEPALDWETDPTSNFILEEFKSVAEYAGYEWQVVGDDILAAPPQSLDKSSSRYNLLMGSLSDYGGTLPELPYVALLNGNLGIDGGSIRNAYTVEGANGINATDENPESILAYGRFEGYYKDDRLTSRQSCQLVARQLSQINGVPRTSLSVAHRGMDEITVGDVVRVADQAGTFDQLDNPYVRAVTQQHSYGLSWKTATTLGFKERQLSDFI